MSKLRICDSRCHNAGELKCRCWCGGTFHGTNGWKQREFFEMKCCDGRRMIDTGREMWLYITKKTDREEKENDREF